jgi:hypothetical protein
MERPACCELVVDSGFFCRDENNGKKLNPSLCCCVYYFFFVSVFWVSYFCSSMFFFQFSLSLPVFLSFLVSPSLCFPSFLVFPPVSLPSLLRSRRK